MARLYIKLQQINHRLKSEAVIKQQLSMSSAELFQFYMDNLDQIKNELQNYAILKSFSFYVVREQQSTYYYSEQIGLKYQYSNLYVRVDQFQQSVSTRLIKSLFNHKFLSFINIVGAKIKDIGISLIHKAQWKFINHAKFDNVQMSEKGVKTIVQCNWKYLSYLKLSNNKIGNKGIVWLAKGRWYKLKHLHLQNCGLSSCSIRLFGKGLLNNLKSLNIYSNQLNFQCLKYLISPNAYELTRLNFSQTSCVQIFENVLHRLISKVRCPFNIILVSNDIDSIIVKHYHQTNRQYDQQIDSEQE